MMVYTHSFQGVSFSISDLGIQISDFRFENEE
jgi:hypothetical protein